MPSVWFVFLEVVWLWFFVPYQSDNPINSGPEIFRGVSAAPLRRFRNAWWLPVEFVDPVLLGEGGVGNQTSCLRWAYN